MNKKRKEIIMKIKKIIDLCVKTGQIGIFNDEKNDVQWITNGVAIYPLEGLPHLSSGYICALYDINDKKVQKLKIHTYNEMPKGIDLSDTVENESPANILNVTIFADGFSYVPILTEQGQIFIDNKYLIPLTDYQMSDLQFYLRFDSSNRPMIAIKNGFLLVTQVYPINISQPFVDRLENLYKASKLSLNNNLFNNEAET
ncbi:MAG: hypothetical protein ACI4HO_02210 [Ruminococcus sp.]